MTTQLHRDAAYQLAAEDPLDAAKVMFRALKSQSPGGRGAVIRYLVEELVRHDPLHLASIVADLHGIAERVGKRPLI